MTAVLLLASCGGGGDDDGDGGDPSVWHFRGVNVIADAPNVQFSIDGTAVENANADYGAVTAYHPAHTGTRPIELAIRNPSNLSGTASGFTDIGTSQSYDFQGPTDYTLVAAGTVADPRQFLITGTLQDDVDEHELEYQVINAAIGTGPVEVFLTAPEAGIDTPTSIGALDPGEYTQPTNLELEQASGADEDDPRGVNLTFEVRAGANVIYQSSALGRSEQNVRRLLIVVADNVGPPDVSPVKLFVIEDVAAGGAVLLLDPDDGTEMRVANVSPDAGPIEFGIVEASGLFPDDIDFGQQSAYEPLPVDAFNAIATSAINPGAVLFVNNFTTNSGRSSTLYAQGPATDLRGIIMLDDRRRVPTEAHFRFLHAAPSESAGPLDVYIVQDGAAFDLNAASPPSPLMQDLPYRTATPNGYFVLDQGAYDVYFARANAKTVLLGPLDLSLTDGSVQTLVLADLPGAGGLTLVPVDDARP